MARRVASSRILSSLSSRSSSARAAAWGLRRANASSSRLVFPVAAAPRVVPRQRRQVLVQRVHLSELGDLAVGGGELSARGSRLLHEGGCVLLELAAAAALLV